MQQRIVLILVSYLFFSVAPVQARWEASVLLSCYKAHETQVEIAACLDRQHILMEEKLAQAEMTLNQQLKQLDKSSAGRRALDALIDSQQTFADWREQQCKQEEASYPKGQNNGQAYLSCLIDRTDQQIMLLDQFAGLRFSQ